jgi:hypothetical protein
MRKPLWKMLEDSTFNARTHRPCTRAKASGRASVRKPVRDDRDEAWSDPTATTS